MSKISSASRASPVWSSRLPIVATS
jgi:hypothetical protein